MQQAVTSIDSLGIVTIRTIGSTEQHSDYPNEIFREQQTNPAIEISVAQESGRWNAKDWKYARAKDVFL